MKKKILIFIDWYLPGYKAGGPIRSCANLVSQMSNEFDFFIATRDTDYMDSLPYKTIKNNSWNKLSDGSSVFYISNNALSKSSIKKIIEEVNPEIIYLNSVFSYWFTILPLIVSKKKYKVILASRGMFASGAMAIKSFKKNIFLFFSKTFCLYSKVIFQASSKEEEQQIANYFPKSKIIVAPNLPRKISNSKTEIVLKSSGEARLLNIARIAPEKNLLFGLEVLKNVKGKVVFDFYGPIYDNQYWDKCKIAFSNLPQNITVTYKGILNSEDIFNKLNDHHFLFLPSRGENFGHIILEAMSAGMPAIISDTTPWRNLQQKNAGWDISLVKPDEFSKVIDKCVEMNNEEYELLSKGTSKLAADYINDEGNINANRLLFS